MYSFTSGLCRRSFTFWRRVSYSLSSRCIFRSSACRAVLRTVSSSSSAFSFSAEVSLVSPAFLISLAAASNKIISLSNPRILTCVRFGPRRNRRNRSPPHWIWRPWWNSFASRRNWPTHWPHCWRRPHPKNRAGKSY